MKKTTLPLVLVMAAILLAAAGCGGNNNTNNAPPPANNSNNAPEAPPAGNAGTVDATAEAVYKQQCISCHAADLSGGVGPNLQKIGATMSADQISTQIQNGGGGMPPFKGTLTDDEITALTDWLANHK
jgi:cytochrome c551